jgi:CheY-like chemotaxis protein
VVVDDNKNFLGNFSLRLGANLAYRLFTSPWEALRYLNDAPPSAALLKRCLTNEVDCTSSAPVPENLLKVNLDLLKDELGNRRRFEETSVVIIDYDMPGLNGIEFCRLIQNPGIKKILLTGVADEKLAVSAFNEGLIDKFIRKQDNQNIAVINQHIAEFHDLYFSEKGALLKSALDADSFGFLLSPPFLDLFHRLGEQYRAVEYYLTCKPSGYILLTQDKKLLHLIVQSEEDMRDHAEIVRDYGGPEALFNLIEQRAVIPYFWEKRNAGGYYYPEVSNWRKCVYPCSLVGQGGPYYYALIESPDYFVRQDDEIYHHSQYLAEMEAAPTFS